MVMQWYRIGSYTLFFYDNIYQYIPVYHIFPNDADPEGKWHKVFIMFIKCDLLSIIN